MAKFIAEIGSNHNGSLERAGALIAAAAKAGCDAVKVQLFDARKVFCAELLEKSEVHRERLEWTFDLAWLPMLKAAAMGHGMELGASVYAIEDVKAAALYCDFLKIGSYDLLRLDLIKAAAETGKPVVISTGMASDMEVDAAFEQLLPGSTLLHCISAYPVPEHYCALSRIKSHAEVYRMASGWSDHSRSPSVICRAVWQHGASMIEFHLDLEDGAGFEYGAHCWKPSEIAPVIGCCAEPVGLYESTLEVKERHWRSDPSDGLRPMVTIRGEL